MAIKVSEAPRQKLEPIPAGTHLAVCTRIIDLGVQPGGQYDPRRQVWFGWQLPQVRRKWTDRNGQEHDSAATIGNSYTLSLGSKANLRRVLETWRAKAFTDVELKDFDLTVFLGKPCFLSVVHAEKGADIYANVGVVLAPPPGTVIQCEGELLEYSTDAPDEAVFAKLSKRLQERIQNRIKPAPTAQSIGSRPVAPASTATVQAVPEEMEEDIPF